jgi:N-acetylmuramoyl-L-alanine amidase
MRKNIILTLSLLILANASRLWAEPAVDKSKIEPAHIQLLLNGAATTLSSVEWHSEEFLAIEQLARLSESQLGWQSITKQACLSNVQGIYCFNWENSFITLNGDFLTKKYPLLFDNNQLFVPIKFIVSKDFQAFSKTKIEWNKELKQLTQTPIITLPTPQVEKLSDRYRLQIPLSEIGDHQLLEKTNQKIWIRFVDARSEGSQVLEGDGVIREIDLIQKRKSVDMIFSMGSEALNNDVYYDSENQNLVVDVFTRELNSSEEQDRRISPAVHSTKNEKIISRPVQFSKKSPPIIKPMPVVTPVIKKSPTIVTAPAQKNQRTIVIDAGHGGMDAGAMGARRTMEKDINLEVAKALAKQLSKEKNVRVLLTRDSDVFIPLEQRTEFANSANADLFVSIHCNSSISTKNTGFEVYFLSPEATDKAAEAVARFENSVVSLEGSKGNLSNKLTQLLASMAVSSHINQSSKFAALIVRGMKNKTNVEKTAIKEADFFVLRGAQMPAILIELEYLSNPVAEVKLRSSRFRNQMIKGLVDGILAYDKELRLEKEAMVSNTEKYIADTSK